MANQEQGHTGATADESRFCMCITPDGLPEDAQRLLDGRKAALLDQYRWQSGNAIEILFMAGSAKLRKRVRAAAEGWIGPTMANLSFSWRSNGPANVRIDFVVGDGSWSYIGTYCRDIPADEPTMNFGWLTDDSSDEDVRQVVLHEFGHAVGLIHEHQNPRNAVKWNEPAVIRDLSGPPNNWDLATIQHNLFDRYDPTKVTATRVDGRSIMMYPIPRSWTLDGFSAGLNVQLSTKDRKFIRTAYPHS